MTDSRQAKIDKTTPRSAASIRPRPDWMAAAAGVMLCALAVAAFFGWLPGGRHSDRTAGNLVVLLCYLAVGLVIVIGPRLGPRLTGWLGWGVFAAGCLLLAKDLTWIAPQISGLLEFLPEELRSAPASAAGLMLGGASLALRRNPHLAYLVAISAALAGMIGLVTLVGFAFGVGEIHPVPGFGAVPVWTGLGLLALAVGLLFRQHNLPIVSLKLALSLLVIGALLPALLFMAAQARQAAAERQLNLERDSRELAEKVSVLAERLLAERAGLLRGLATSPALRTGDLAGFYDQAKGALDPVGEGVLVVVDRAMRLRMSTAVPFGAPMPAPRDSGTNARAFQSGQMQVSDIFISAFTQKPVVSLAQPIAGTEFVLRLTIWSSWLSEQLRAAAPPGWIIGLADAKGIVVARSQDPERWMGRPVSPALADGIQRAEIGSGSIRTRDDVEIYAAWRRLPFGWTAVVGVDENNLDTVLRTQTRHVTLGAIVVTAAGLLFALLAALGIGRPLARLSAAAAALGQGTVPSALQSHLREINAVDAALRDSATARHVVEATLREREALLQSATDNAAVGLVMLDTNRRYTFANPTYVQILGLPYSADDLVGKDPEDMLPEIYPAQIRPHLDRAFAGERVRFELTRPHADGDTAYYDVVYDPKRDVAGAVEGVIVTIFDITARKTAEQAMFRSEERLRLAQDAARVGSWEWRLSDNKNIWSEPLWNLFGLDLKTTDASYDAWVTSIHPADRDRVIGVVGAAAAAAREFEMQWRVRVPEGEPDRWLMARGRPVIGADGKAERYIGIVIDITARVRADEALHESERRIGAILEALPIGVALLDREGRAIVDNAMYRRFELTGALIRDDARNALWDGFDASGRPLPRKDYPVALALRGEAAWPGNEFHFRGDDARAPVWTRVAALPFHDTDGAVAGAIHMIVDIDAEKQAQEERRTLQAELLHVSRLSEMGQMAAALAHELNQPLTAISVNIGACQRLINSEATAAAKAKLQQLMQSASDQALRAGEIIRQLREFVHKGAGDRRVESAADVMREASVLAITAAKHNGVSVRTEIEPSGDILVNKVQIQQVVFNLVRNAIEAMETTPRKELAIALANVNGAAQASIADTGTGLAPEMLDRLFLPFSSTKSGGMGIGLSVCRNIVEAHDGRIWAEANPGGGTVFRFSLPLVQDSAEEEADSA